MKNSLSHLPQIKQAELQKLVAAIQKNCDDVEKIILFGSYAKGNYKEAKDLKPNRKTGHISDYDILVVTGKKQTALDRLLWSNISDICKNLNLSASPRILTHDIEKLNIKLAEGQYFYSDIVKEGILLFDSGKSALAKKRQLTMEEKKRIAQGHFDEWFTSATQFFENYKFNLEKNWNKKAAFNLHQTSESAYKTATLVFTNYNPNEHFLAFLGDEAAKCHPSFKNIFPKNTKEEKSRFDLLEYAYIGGRYDPEFYISKEDLEILAKYVKKLLEVTKKVCEQKIQSF